jgi:hypothetical protein
MALHNIKHNKAPYIGTANLKIKSALVWRGINHKKQNKTKTI